MPVRVLVAAMVALLVALPVAPPSAGATTPRPDPLDLVREAVDVRPGERVDLTLALRDLWLARGEVAPARRTAADGLLARPSDAGAHAAWRYPADVARERTCSARLCVTRVEEGPHRASEAWAAATLQAFGTAWQRIVDDLGYRAPALDGDEGGDDRFDVYLADLAGLGDLYGFCAAEENVPGQAARATSFCVVDNDMTGLGHRPQDALAATAAHELFHAVQFNYDVAEDPWFMESSATWVEGQVFPALRDNRQFLVQGQLGRPTTPLDSPAARYGNWIFVQYLAQRGGTDVVRRIWERLDASTGTADEWSLQGVRRQLATQGVAWPRLYADFVRANLRPARHYADGAGMPRARATGRLTLGPRTRAATRTARLAHLSSRTLRIRVSPRAEWPRAVRLELRATRAAHAAVQLLVEHRGGRVTHRRVALRANGRGAARVALRGTRVRRLVVLSSHSGADYRNCGTRTGWACGGDPVGDLRVRVRATLVG